MEQNQALAAEQTMEKNKRKKTASDKEQGMQRESLAR
jgi:hypothetical protein